MAGIPLVWIETPSSVTFVLSAVFLIFSVHGLFACARFRTRVHLDPDHISMLGARKRSIQWSKLRGVRLAYYTTRRDREQGWFRMSLRGLHNQCLAVDSRLTDFHLIARQVAVAAHQRNILPDPASRENFRALGIPIDDHCGLPPP